MSNLPQCPKCKEDYTYEDGNLLVCPMCSHEWNQEDSDDVTSGDLSIVTDSNGAVLQDGDSVTIIKDLKVKGAASSIKIGTKVKKIRLVEGSDGHNIECKIDGFGAMKLKSEFVKKA